MVLKSNTNSAYDWDRSDPNWTRRTTTGTRDRNVSVHIKSRIEGQLASIATLTGKSKSIGGATEIAPYTVLTYVTVTGHWEPWITGETVDGVVLPNSEDQDLSIVIDATLETLIVVGTSGDFHYDTIKCVVPAQRAALDTALKLNSRLIVDDIVGRRG